MVLALAGRDQLPGSCVAAAVGIYEMFVTATMSRRSRCLGRLIAAAR
jgi:hypothetical protein